MKYSNCSIIMSVLLILLLVVAPIHGQYIGDVRLVGGSYPWEGRVEIFLSWTWGTITDFNWTSHDAQVVCRKMGHFKPGATAHPRAYFGEGSGLIQLESVVCSGSEYSLTDCITENSRTFDSHSLDVGVKCQPADEAYREGDIRLVGGVYNWEGRVEIFWMGSWGTISDSSWTTNDAIVVCRQLQHSTGSGVPVYCCDAYGEGVGDIHIRDVTCDGSENNITSCAYHNVLSATHQHDVMVQCQQGNEAKEGDVHLIGSGRLSSGYIYGRVEIFLSGVWGTVLDDRTGANDATVVCRQLGYNTYRVNHRCCAGYRQGRGPIHLQYPFCTGLEHRLTDCQYYKNTVERSPSQDWSVSCYIDGPELGDVRLSETYYGYVEVFFSGRWIHIANSGNTWTEANSIVVCRELGHTNKTTWYYSRYDSTAFEQIDNVVCTGTEQKLTDCSFGNVSVDSDLAVSVNCGYNHHCYGGDMRLVGGETEAEGRVEVCDGGFDSWGTVCGRIWTDTNTAVVCRHFGFSDIVGDSTHFTSERFGRGTGPILMDQVYCTGPESELWNCEHFTHYYGCSHNDDVGVHCKPASCANGQLRLIYSYGYGDDHGRVEICSNQRWETLDYFRWSPFTARVACIELGFDTYRTWQTQFGTGGGPIHPKYYLCTGAEQRVSQCKSYNHTEPISHHDDVGIYCCPADCIDWQLRLAEGQTEWEGRLEVCNARRWGTVGSEGWSQVNSQVVCNALGYDIREEGTASRPIQHSLSKPVHFVNVVCQTTSLTLEDCSYTKYSGNINNVADVTVICQKPTCRDGDLKLVGGSVLSEGRLHICFNQRWTTINDEKWTYPDTIVACKQLGYPPSEFEHYKIQRSLASLPAVIYHLGCSGTEERLIDCHYSETISTPNDYDVGIVCVTSDSTTPVTVPTTGPVTVPTTGTDTTSIMDNSSSTATLTTMNNTTLCYNCTSVDSGSQTSIVLAATLSTAVLCLAVIVFVAGLLVVVFIRRKRKRCGMATITNTTGDTSSTYDDEGGKLHSFPPMPLTEDNCTVDNYYYDRCK